MAVVPLIAVRSATSARPSMVHSADLLAARRVVDPASRSDGLRSFDASIPAVPTGPPVAVPVAGVVAADAASEPAPAPPVTRSTHAVLGVAARPTPPTTVVPRPSETGPASWYDAPAGTCAHQSLPFGTLLTVTDLNTGRSVSCRVEDRGPYEAGRILDLSRSTFAQLAPLSSGVIQVRITW